MKRFHPLFLALILLLAVVAISAQARQITPNGRNQGDLVDFLTLLQNRANTGTMTYPNVAKGGTASKTLDIGTTFTYSINGVSYTKTASAACGEITATVQATGTSCMYLLSVGPTGTVTTTKGTAVSYLATPSYPAVPANTAPFGAVKVVILPGASAAFTLGTTAFNWSHIATATVYNLRNVPLDITDF